MGKSGRHKRGKPGHGGHQGGSKRQYPGGGRRRGGGSGRGPEIVSDDDGPGGTLHIGGVVVRVDGAGNGVAQLAGHRQQRRRGSAGSLLAPMPPLRRQSCSSASYASGSGDGSSSDGKEGRLGDEAMEDYLANLGAGSSGHSSDGTASHSSGSQADVEGARSAGTGSAAKRRRQAYEQYEVLRRFSGFEMGDEGPPENLGWPGFSSDEQEDSSSSDGSGSTSSGDGDGSSGSSGSSRGGSDSDSEGGSESSSEEDSWEGGSSDEGDELMEADLEQLSLAQRFPVQVRPRPPPLPGQQQAGKQAGSSGKAKKKGKSAVKGAKGGKLAPGEKKRLKKERMEAKRAARAAARGFDLAWVNRQLEEFVARQGDMQAFGPFGKHEGKAVARLAALYGCRTSLQGSKSNRKLVMVSSTPRTCLPQGANLLAIGQILAAQTAAERSGAAMDGRLAAAVAGADLSSVLPLALAAAGSGRGRWAGVQRGAGGAGGSGAGAKAKKKRSKLKPVAFVSVGAINPDDAVEVAMPTAPILAGSEAETALEAVLADISDVNMAGEPGSGLAGQEPVAHVEAAAQQQQQRRRKISATAAAVQLLEVIEDRQGDVAAAAAGGLPQLAADAALAPKAAEEEEEAGAYASDEASEEERTALGSGSALYTRMTALTLQSQDPSAVTSVAAASPRSARGSAAAEGITNPGRLLGLSLALGIGAEVFGAPGPAIAASPADVAADLSPLSPLLSKSQLRKLQRRVSGRASDTPASALVGGGTDAGLGGLAAAAASGGGKQQHQQPGRKGKPGRSKQERRARDSGASVLAAAAVGMPAAPSSSEEDERPQQHLGIGAGVGSSAGARPAGGSDGGTGGGGRALVSGDYGYFERHTTGIGSKLLAKWGFAGEGAGLGRGQRGRAEPLQAVRRAKGLGLGAER